MPGRRDECDKCRADVHVCRNCKHYDPKVYNECREPQADRVQERIDPNFVIFFEIGTASGGFRNEINNEQQRKPCSEEVGWGNGDGIR